MNLKTKEAIEKHIEKIIQQFVYSKRKLKNPKDCPCYLQNKPCHNISENKLNCFLCFCPEYDSSIPEGGCKMRSEKGQWFFNESLPKGKIWDCSNCDNPHNEETVRKHLRNLFGVN